MGQSTRTSGLAERVTPRTKVWLESDGRYVFGLGICEILKAVQATGSIKSAAQKIGKSYRHIWDRVKETEQALGAPLVRTQVGGKDVRRSEITPLAQDLVVEFEALRARLFALVHEEFPPRLRALLNRYS